MHISQNKLQGILETYRKTAIDARKTPIKGSKAKFKDELKLSDDFQELSKILKKATKPDKIRKEKIHKLRREIQKGNYNIDGKLVADKIIQKFFPDIRN